MDNAANANSSVPDFKDLKYTRPDLDKFTETVQNVRLRLMTAKTIEAADEALGEYEIAISSFDTQYALCIILQILFFATPIFYPVSAVPENMRGLLTWNPLSVFIEQARNVFLYGKLPDWCFLGLSTAVAVVVLQFGVFFFRRTKRGFADVL